MCNRPTNLQATRRETRQQHGDKGLDKVTMTRNRLILGLALAATYAQLLFSGTAASSDNCYDHQTQTYDARFRPTYCTKTCTVTPFFSPDTSIATYASLIEAATESIDIYSPGTCRSIRSRACTLLRSIYASIGNVHNYAGAGECVCA